MLILKVEKLTFLIDQRIIVVLYRQLVILLLLYQATSSFANLVSRNDARSRDNEEYEILYRRIVIALLFV